MAPSHKHANKPNPRAELTYKSLASHPALAFMRPPDTPRPKWGNLDYYTHGNDTRAEEHFRGAAYYGETGTKARVMMLFLWLIAQTLPPDSDASTLVSGAVAQGLPAGEDIDDYEEVIHELVDTFRRPLPDDMKKTLESLCPTRSDAEFEAFMDLVRDSYKEDVVFDYAVEDAPSALLNVLEGVVIVPRKQGTERLIAWCMDKFFMGRWVNIGGEPSDAVCWSAHISTLPTAPTEALVVAKEPLPPVTEAAEAPTIKVDAPTKAEETTKLEQSSKVEGTAKAGGETKTEQPVKESQTKSPEKLDVPAATKSSSGGISPVDSKPKSGWKRFSVAKGVSRSATLLKPTKSRSDTKVATSPTATTETLVSTTAKEEARSISSPNHVALLLRGEKGTADAGKVKAVAEAALKLARKVEKKKLDDRRVLVYLALSIHPLLDTSKGEEPAAVWVERVDQTFAELNDKRLFRSVEDGQAFALPRLRKMLSALLLVGNSLSDIQLYSMISTTIEAALVHAKTIHKTSDAEDPSTVLFSLAEVVDEIATSIRGFGSPSAHAKKGTVVAAKPIDLQINGASAYVPPSSEAYLLAGHRLYDLKTKSSALTMLQMDPLIPKTQLTKAIMEHLVEEIGIGAWDTPALVQKDHGLTNGTA